MPAKSVLLAILLSEFSYATVFAWKSLCPSRRTGIGFQKTVQNHESTFDLEHGLQNCAKRSEARQGAVGTWVLQLFLLVEYCRTLHYLSIYLPTYLSIYLSSYLAIYLPTYLSIYLFLSYLIQSDLFVYLSIDRSIDRSIYLSFLILSYPI